MVKNETIFQKLKTEIIPLSQNKFMWTIESLADGEANAETVEYLLSECFYDDEGIIENLLDKDDKSNLTSDADEVYKLLVTDMQSKFKKSIDKKFTKKYMDEVPVGHKNENRIFTTKTMKISDIKIKPEYKDLLPSGYKMGKVWEYYKKNSDFPTQIVIDKDDYLLEGYSKYLICKALEISDVLCYTIQ